VAGREAAGLLRKASAGDHESASQLFRLFGRRLYGLAFRILSDRTAAEDVVGDVFLAVLSGKARYRGTGSAVGFLLRAASSIAIDRARRVQMGRAKEGEAAARREAAPRSGSAALDAVLRKELEAEMADLLRALDPEDRSALALRFWGEATIGEIASVLAAPRSTVALRIERALGRLRGPLLRKGLGASVAVSVLGEILRGMEAAPPSQGFTEAVEGAIRSAGSLPPPDVPPIPEPPLFAAVPGGAATVLAGLAAACIAVVAAVALSLPGKPAAPDGDRGVAISSGTAPGGAPAASRSPAGVVSGASPTEQAVVLEGRVVGPDGRPAVGARLRLQQGEGRGGPAAGLDESAGGRVLAEAVTGAEGAFRFDRLPEGPYRIAAMAAGTAPGTSGLLRAVKFHEDRDLRTGADGVVEILFEEAGADRLFIQATLDEGGDRIASDGASIAVSGGEARVVVLRAGTAGGSSR
jgi:RNA polymerase sigma-70 factor (ECF subfamily)